MSNVKPGDLAIAVGNKHTGRIFEVLSAAPAGVFNLPDGYSHSAERYGSGPHWVLKTVGGPILAPLPFYRHRSTYYGVGSDVYLRPLPGETEEADELECGGIGERVLQK